MELFHMRRRSGAVLLIILIAAAMCLASCRGADTGSSGKKEAVSFLQPCRMKSSDGNIYDITQLIPEKEESGVLCTYGFFDETRLLLLRGTYGEDGAVSEYTAQFLDLCNGETSLLTKFVRAGSLQEESDGTQDLEILCSDPLVIHDSMNGILYRPGSGAGPFILPRWLRDSVPFWFRDRLWIASDRGIIYEITGDGILNAAWTLPSAYKSIDPVVYGHDGFLTFITSSLQDPSARIYADVNPADGESRFYYSDLNPARFSVFSEGLLLGSSFRTTPKVSVCDPDARTKKEIELPEEIRSLIEGNMIAPSQDDDGGFVAFRTVPLSLCSDWSSFMLSDISGRPRHIYLWDTASCGTTVWSGPSESEYTAPSEEDYGRLSRMADDLEAKYGVKIVLGSNVPTEFADYSADPVTDPDIIEGSLSVLDNVLSLYPEGYFTALKGSYYRDIVLYMAGEMRPLNAGSNISNAGAFATESGGLMQIAFDLYGDISPSIVVHELTHAADYRFAGEGLLDEDDWNAMNPGGFSYYLAYIDENGESYETSGSEEYTAQGGSPADEVYFIDPYSKTFPMEDRARLMENLMSGRSPYADCFSGVHVQEKLSFYFRFLRETLDDGTWPSLTTWEEALENASSGN